MPRSNTGPGGRTLTGGRALYTGKNAYASQGFENDTRQTQLGGLLIAYPSTQTMNAGSATILDFSQSYLSSTFSQLFLRGFSYNTIDKIFSCRQSGTYRFSYCIDMANLVAGGSAVGRLYVMRETNGRVFLSIFSNPDGANTMRAPLVAEGIIDLQKGDQLYMESTTTNAAILAGVGTTTSPRGGLLEEARSYLTLEQIDLPAPS